MLLFERIMGFLCIWSAMTLSRDTRHLNINMSRHDRNSKVI